MNNLSWLIYWAGFADGMSNLCCVFVWFGAIGCIISFILWLVVGFNPKDPECTAMAPFTRSLKRLFVTMFVIAVSGYLLLPTRQTIILIAGSEMGERLFKSETVQGMVDPGLDLIQSWVQSETAKLQVRPAEPKK